MFKNISVLGFMLALLSAPALCQDKILSAIEVSKIGAEYTVILDSPVVNIKKNVEDSNNISIELKNVKAANNIKTSYTNAAGIANVAVQSINNKTIVNIQGTNVANSRVLFGDTQSKAISPVYIKPLKPGFDFVFFIALGLIALSVYALKNINRIFEIPGAKKKRVLSSEFAINPSYIKRINETIPRKADIAFNKEASFKNYAQRRLEYNNKLNEARMKTAV